MRIEIWCHYDLNSRIFVLNPLPHVVWASGLGGNKRATSFIFSFHSLFSFPLILHQIMDDEYESVLLIIRECFGTNYFDNV